MIEKFDAINRVDVAALMNGTRRVEISTKAAGSENVRNSSVKSFSEVLSDALKKSSKITFSAHAEKRMQSRGIVMALSDYDRLNAAIDRLNEKKAGESLVLMDNKAFVVSAKNRTVITAAVTNELKNNVFTNIDSAIIA